MTTLLAVLQEAGLDAVGHRDWLNHSAAGDFQPVGIMEHHIAATGSWVVDLCYNGRSDLRGPLCNIVAMHTGRLHVVSNRKGRDSGYGDPDVLGAVRRGAPDLPAPNDTDTHRVNGNPYFYDIEMEGPPFTEVQLEAVARASAAICRWKGWTSHRVIAHKEWSRRKPDPKDLDMEVFRNRVQRWLRPQEDEMNAAQEAKLDLVIDRVERMFAKNWDGGSLAWLQGVEGVVKANADRVIKEVKAALADSNIDGMTADQIIDRLKARL